MPIFCEFLWPRNRRSRWGGYRFFLSFCHSIVNSNLANTLWTVRLELWYYTWFYLATRLSEGTDILNPWIWNLAYYLKTLAIPIHFFTASPSFPLVPKNFHLWPWLQCLTYVLKSIHNFLTVCQSCNTSHEYSLWSNLSVGTKLFDLYVWLKIDIGFNL